MCGGNGEVMRCRSSKVRMCDSERSASRSVVKIILVERIVF